jgi:hypothetical protein
MRTSALTGIAASATALALVLSGCGSNTEKTTTSATSTTASAPTSGKLAKPVRNDGPNPTIADYIRDHKLTEDQVHRGDTGAPKIDLPTPDGWKAAGDDNPQWAYDSIIYSGPAVAKDTDDADDTPSIIALLSKLTGNIDPKALLAAAPGELQNLPGFMASGPGTATTLGSYPAYQAAGTWTSDGKTKFVAQKTVVIPAKDATYVLQLNSDGAADQSALVQAATVLVGQQTKVTL